MFTPFSYDWYHEDSTSASTDDFDYFLEDTLSVETEDEFSEPFSHIGSPVASRFNSWNHLPFNGFEDHKEPIVPTYQANVMVHSDSESGFVHSDEPDFPLDSEKHHDSDGYYGDAPPSYPMPLPNIKNEDYDHPKHDFLVPPKPLRTSRSHSHPSITHSIPTTPNMQPTHTFQFSNDLQTSYSQISLPSPSHTLSNPPPSPIPQYGPPQIIPKTKYSPPSYSQSHPPSYPSSYAPSHPQSHISAHPPSYIPSHAPSHASSYPPTHTPSHYTSHHQTHHSHPQALPPSHPSKPYVHHSFFQPNHPIPHPNVRQGPYQPALDAPKDCNESSADSFLSDSCLEGAESDYNRSQECTPINSPSQSGFLEETLPTSPVETRKRVRTTESSESTDEAGPTKIPKTKPSSFPRKKFRETIGNQIYQDLVSEKFSYDEIISKYSTLYPEYAHKFTPSFCSKVRCGRIMNTEAKAAKAKEVEAPKSRIKRVSRLSHRKTWRKMTPELFAEIFEWESHQQRPVKLTEFEQLFNVNRSTYYRWKKSHVKPLAQS